MNENSRIGKNKSNLLGGLKHPDIEDLVTEEEPEFYGLKMVHENTDLEKTKYFAKWMDLVFLEENEEFKRHQFMMTNNRIVLECNSVEDLHIIFTDKDAVEKYKSSRIMTFSEYFDSEDLVDGGVISSMNVNSKVRLIHPASKIGISGVLKRKQIKKKKLGKLKFYQVILKVLCNNMHVRKQFERHLSVKADVNIDKLTKGWIYERKSYGFHNTMRRSMVNLVTKKECSRLANYIIHGKKPTEIPIKGLDLSKILKHNVNSDQMAALTRALQTDSFSLVLGMPGTGKTRLICILIDILI